MLLITSIVVFSLVILLTVVSLLYQRSLKLKALRRDLHAAQKQLQLTKNEFEDTKKELQDLKVNLDVNFLHDPVTGLASFTLFQDRLHQILNQSKRYQLIFAVLFLDIDDFKTINNVLGKELGDVLLKEVAERTLTCVRKVDTVSRYTADSFAIILSQLNKPETAAFAAQRMLDAIAQPFEIGGRELFITASIGISIYPDDNDEDKALLKYADIALHQAKIRGQNTYQFYHEDLYALSRRELLLNFGLRSEVVYSQLQLYYQPELNIISKETVCMEALLRWNHPDLGVVPPMDFLRLAENSGRIIAIGDWVLQSACQQLKIWRNQGFPDLTVAVNVSMRQLENTNFTYKVSQILQELSLEPAALTLEISEIVLLPNLDKVEKTMHMLNHLGVNLAIDDFGTGYLALQHLRRFPVNYLKIDNTLTKDVAINKETAAIIKMIISMADSLGLKTVAEGVESENQKKILQSLGCNLMQGHYFSPPRLPQELTRVAIEKLNEHS